MDAEEIDAAAAAAELKVRKLSSLQQIPALNQPSAEIAKAGVAWILEIKAQAEEPRVKNN